MLEERPADQRRRVDLPDIKLEERTVLVDGEFNRDQNAVGVIELAGADGWLTSTTRTPQRQLHFPIELLV